MTGWIMPLTGRGSRKPELLTVSGLPLLRAVYRPGGPPRAEARSMLRAGRRLCRAGVRRVLTEEQFEGWPLLEQLGLRPVEVQPLCRALASRLILAKLHRDGTAPERASVVLRGERVDRSLYQCANDLCPLLGVLAIEVPRGGDALCRQLREEYGAAVPERLAWQADCTVDFAPRPEATPGALQLFGPRPFPERLGLAGPEPLPGPVASLPFYALLWEEKRVKLEELRLFSL